MHTKITLLLNSLFLFTIIQTKNLQDLSYEKQLKIKNILYSAHTDKQDFTNIRTILHNKQMCINIITNKIETTENSLIAAKKERPILMSALPKISFLVAFIRNGMIVSGLSEMLPIVNKNAQDLKEITKNINLLDILRGKDIEISPELVDQNGDKIEAAMSSLIKSILFSTVKIIVLTKIETELTNRYQKQCTLESTLESQLQFNKNILTKLQALPE